MSFERAGYTVTMFLVDLSPSMGLKRHVPLPNGKATEVSNLSHGLQYVKLKMQEMIYNGRKTDKCGVIVFGSEETQNIVNDKDGGYEHVSEYIPIEHPTAATLAQLDELQPSSTIGDPIDALIVAIETQNRFLGTKKTWTRRIVLVTDGVSPMELEDWETIVDKMNELNVSLTVIGIDFDSEDLPFHEEDKEHCKSVNEQFYTTLTDRLNIGIVGNCEFAIQEAVRPEPKMTKSTLMRNILRLGDTEVQGADDEALEITVMVSKCTAQARPKGWKRFVKREDHSHDGDDEDSRMNVDESQVGGAGGAAKAQYAELLMRPEYYVNRSEDADDEAPIRRSGDESNSGGDNDDEKPSEAVLEKVEREELIRGFKYGSTFVPCPDGQFPRKPTRKGIDICGFVKEKFLRRDYLMGEISYIVADTASPPQQAALGSIVRAMHQKGVLAIARLVSRDDADPKMGVLKPCVEPTMDYLLWAQMPFADDVRRFRFAPLDALVSKRGEVIKEHVYLPTQAQQAAMDEFVDALDLMEAGEKDEDGKRTPWFDIRQSYNPAVHRTKQALFHAAVVADLETNPIPPPHVELLKYFEPPKRVLKRARETMEECRRVFNVREVPKKVPKARKEDHVRAQSDDEEEPLLLDGYKPEPEPKSSSSSSQNQHAKPSLGKTTSSPGNESVTESETESEDEEGFLLGPPSASMSKAREQEKEKKKRSPSSVSVKSSRRHLPTPSRSSSPDVDYDPGREPGRVIGTTRPLKDFHEALMMKQGDSAPASPVKAMDDLVCAILEIVRKPFASRRSDEIVKCMRSFREVAVKEHTAEKWNRFLYELKEECTGSGGDKAIWNQVRGVGRELSLISQLEVANVGDSSVTEVEAEKFLDNQADPV